MKLTFEKPGIYWVSVTAINATGCSNCKVFPVEVRSEHPPFARDDYVYTDWLSDITFSPLANDYDPGNDLDSTSFQMLSQPLSGKIFALRSGIIKYEPQRRVGGAEVIAYRVCDARNQCDTANINILIREPEIYLPEAISPNGDGKNEYFVIGGLEKYPHSELTIYSRDGTLVYHSNDYQNDWPERNHDKTDVSGGTYYYVFHPGGTSRFIKRFLFVSQ
ncbi:MAG: gliding motility-associated C-terminal domain-containing protein [Marinilabiliales bacterium]|nr:gliding motility-associated C-terminal domain-containing protein [Marinilabiliales bacterium]